MNYSQVAIANMALGRIGARGQLNSLNDNSPNAVKVLAVWDFIFQEVLSERDWRFAKTRANLQLAVSSSFTASISSNTLTVSAIGYGTLAIGSPIYGFGLSSNTIITGLGTGAGGVGTYTLNNSQTISSETMTGGVVPVYGYRHAWLLPSDFLRFVRPHKRPQDRRFWGWLWGPEGWGWYHREDPPLCPLGRPYLIEAVPNGNFDPQGNPAYSTCVLIDYDGCFGPVSINYIRLISDYTQLMPGFVNCLANRLAMELSINITEDKQKFQGLEEMYRNSLNSAESQNESSDLVSWDEAGSTAWEDAGRVTRFW